MKNFWLQLQKPFTVLAPMDGVTDFVFRQIIAEIGRPDVFFTEFTNCDGLVSLGREKLSENLMFGPSQKPIVVQIWGSNPENFYKSAKYIKKLKFDGIDINMGCPDKVVRRHGACGDLIKNPLLAKEIIKAVRKGAGVLPVSVKTRIGMNAPEIEDWISFLLEQNLDAITVHLRTVKELSKVPAHWELMPKIMEMRNKISPKTLIIGNGDIGSLDEVQNKYVQYGCDGFMIGTGIFSNPWLFHKLINSDETNAQSRLKLYLSHIRLFDKTWNGSKNPANLKKFCKMYINNFPNAVSLREKIMETKSIRGMEEVIASFLYPLPDSNR